MQIFKLQITYPDGTIVEVPPGGKLERDLIASCVEAAVAKGVGFLRTEAQVEAAIRAGMTEVFMALKRETIQALAAR